MAGWLPGPHHKEQIRLIKNTFLIRFLCSETENGQIVLKYRNAHRSRSVSPRTTPQYPRKEKILSKANSTRRRTTAQYLRKEKILSKEMILSEGISHCALLKFTAQIAYYISSCSLMEGAKSSWTWTPRPSAWLSFNDSSS